MKTFCCDLTTFDDEEIKVRFRLVPGSSTRRKRGAICFRGGGFKYLPEQHASVVARILRISKCYPNGFKNICYVHPYLGKIPILTSIFQLGWNHQLVFVLGDAVNHHLVTVISFWEGFAS